MMPIWIQLVTAVSAGLVSALLGIALVPYLQKLRMLPPRTPEQADEAAGEERRPILGGLLILAGILFALVLGGTLYLQFSGADRTGAAFAGELRILLVAGVYSAFLCGLGIIADLQTVRGSYRKKLWDYLLYPAVFCAALASFNLLGFTHAQLASNHWLMLLPLPACLCFWLTQGLDRNTDGAALTVNAVELLVLTMLFLRESLSLPSVLTLAGAGACLGSMVWCMHPAKCRISRTGSYLLGGLVPSLCLLTGMYKTLALFFAASALQQLFRIKGRAHHTLTEGMEEAGIAPLPRIAILAGITAFCSVLAMIS